jgi:hypothetical protein
MEVPGAASIRSNAMLSFLTKFADVVRGVVHGFDRLFFRGSLRRLTQPYGLQNYLWEHRILYKDFDAHSEAVTARLEEASLHQARQLGREIRYLNSAQYSKEDIARAIAERDHIKNGLICVLRSVDPCMSFAIHKNHSTHKLEIGYRPRKCIHLYHYQIHPVFGFMHARIQTWFPFRVYVCLNGREWLARQMDQAKLHYVRRDNTFTWLENLAQAQALFDQQLQAHWPSLLGGLAEALNPTHADLFAKFPCSYYWSVEQSEWASDVMFTSRAALERVYPPLLRYALTTFGAVDVLRFLGKAVPAHGKVPHRWRHEISSNVKERPEGARIKHWLNGNSLKLYDKYSNLRAECMVQEPGDFKVYRPAEGDPQGPKDWRSLRLGIADLHRRAEVSQAANERYLEALAAVHDTTPLRQLVEPWCRPAWEPARQRGPQPAPAAEPHAAAPPPPLPPTATAPAAEAHAVPPATPPAAEAPAPQGDSRTPRARRVRALNPLAAADAALLEAVSRHEFLINGLRNRDLRRLLYGSTAATPAEQRRQSAAVTRQLRLLRAHGLLHKVPKTHRYVVGEAARKALTALLAARNANADELIRSAG